MGPEILSSTGFDFWAGTISSCETKVRHTRIWGGESTERQRDRRTDGKREREREGQKEREIEREGRKREWHPVLVQRDRKI